MTTKQEALTKALQTAQLLLRDVLDVGPIVMIRHDGDVEFLVNVVVRITERLERAIDEGMK